MLSFLKKRREEALKPLSEKDIQEKLYGSFRKTLAASSQSVEVREPEPVSRQQLFNPPEEPENRKSFIPETPVSSLRSREPERARGKTDFLKSAKKYWQEKISFSSVKLPKLTMPKIIPRKKPGWMDKIQRIPLSTVAVTIFSIMFIAVAARAVAQWGFHIPFPSFPSEIKIRKIEMPDSDSGQTASEKVSAAVESVPPEASLKPAPPVPAPVPKKFYTIQLIVYEDPAFAERLAERLKGKDLDAFSKAIQTSRGKQRYQVFLGHFDNYPQGQSQLAKYKKLNLLDEFPDCFVRPVVE